jgi:ribonuclease P protein component
MGMIYSVKTINQKEKPGFFVYFVAKKKIFKKAVVRNKAKRIARHGFMEAKRLFLGTENTPLLNKQVIFFLENGIIQESFEEIVQSFKNDLIKINKK